MPMTGGEGSRQLCVGHADGVVHPIDDETGCDDCAVRAVQHAQQIRVVHPTCEARCSLRCLPAKRTVWLREKLRAWKVFGAWRRRKKEKTR